MTSGPEVTSYYTNMADDLATGGHVMSTNMADDLLMQKINKHGGRPCPRRSRDVNKYDG